MNTGEVLRAAVFSAQAHKDQVRKGGKKEPYINHPMRVALTVFSLFPEDYEAVCAALLHDVVEDTKITEEMLRCAFSGRTVDLVMGLTKQSKESDGERLIRKAIDRRHYSSGNSTVQTIKCCDMYDNAKDQADLGDVDYSRMYLSEQRALCNALLLADIRIKVKLISLLDEQERRLM